jgi:DNA replication licensing factor MCM5
MEFKEFAQRPDAYAKLCSMIGPSIYGHSDVKKAIACLLFGGSKKVYHSYQVTDVSSEAMLIRLPADSVLMLCFKLLLLQRLPDGVRLRGDIHVLLLGDPSTAKSQASIG